ncbi:MAG TPA: AIR synthase-related protein, partial [Pseudodesulfovibrio sp.]|nr:AIR synthase-related protein [Pseudodesulfovibrio sp.]
GSEIAGQLGFSDASVPQVDLLTAKKRYETVFQAAQAGLISTCHDCSDGGLGVALAEMCVGGRLGAEVDLDKVPACGELNVTGLLYAESASRLVVSVAPADRGRFETLFAGQPCACIGSVSESPVLSATLAGRKVLGVGVEELARAFKETLAW